MLGYKSALHIQNEVTSTYCITEVDNVKPKNLSININIRCLDLLVASLQWVELPLGILGCVTMLVICTKSYQWVVGEEESR